MKKVMALVLTLVLLLAIVVPTAAFAEDMNTTSSVNVATGGGETPFVKCKWEQQPPAVEPSLEDGDPTHATPGFQILPPLVAGATKTIQYFAVVTDEEDGGNVQQVFADVYHPMYSPEPYGPSKVGGIQPRPYFKYEIPFSLSPLTKAQMITKFQTAWEAGLVTLGEFTYDDIIYELDKGTAKLWWGQAEIDYEQPAGLYDVYVFAFDWNENLSAPVWNQFLYVPVCGIEADFTGIDFGSTKLGVEKMIPGDLIWDDPAGINNATVRNIGNTWAHVTIMFDDMGFGQDVNDTWNVNFDARMGSDDTYYVGPIMPYQEVTLPNALGLSMKDELDISIKIIKGFGEHNGCITLGCVQESFVDPVPDFIVGIHIADEDYPED